MNIFPSWPRSPQREQVLRQQSVDRMAAMMAEIHANSALMRSTRGTLTNLTVSTLGTPTSGTLLPLPPTVKTNCRNCGAPPKVGVVKCEYCDTRF